VKYAIIESGSKQYRVSVGDIIEVEKLAAGGKEAVFDVLMAVDGDTVKIGQPKIKGAKVTAEVLGDEKDVKIRGLRYLKWEGQRKRYGHRQIHTKVKITQIAV
jgi:large subunit ribosomal protein L21